MGRGSVHIAAFFAMLFWGVSYIWSKIAFEYFTPLSTIFMRLIVSSLTLFLIMLMMGKMEKIQKKDRWLFILSSLFNPFIYFIGESYGLERVSATISAFIISTIPVFTPFVAYWFLRERLSVTNVVGLIISFLGVLMIIFNLDFSLAASPVGLAFLFMGVIAALVYGIILRKLTLKYQPVTIIGWQNTIGIFYFLPLFLYFDYPDILEVRPSKTAVYSVILLGVVASSFAYALYAYVVKHIGISKANIYSNLIPVFAAIASFLWLKETFTTFKLIGMFVIIFGVVLSEMERKKWKISANQ
jgi:drug/metabolite transporter (DMT)-like permease